MDVHVHVLSIGALAKAAGVTTPTIRYYEEIGLLPTAHRSESGQRIYDDIDVERLTFIRQCREFGFPIEQVRSLVALTQDSERSCMEAREIAIDHLTEVRNKLSKLKKLERNLTDFVRRCDSACAGGPGPECVILQHMAGPDSAIRRSGRPEKPQ